MVGQIVYQHCFPKLDCTGHWGRDVIYVHPDPLINALSEAIPIMCEMRVLEREAHRALRADERTKFKPTRFRRAYNQAVSICRHIL